MESRKKFEGMESRKWDDYAVCFVVAGTRVKASSSQV
jgi:hypothetical protein